MTGGDQKHEFTDKSRDRIRIRVGIDLLRPDNDLSGQIGQDHFSRRRPMCTPIDKARQVNFKGTEG